MPNKCPKCQKTLTRLRRKAWMHYIPGGKYYVCRKCRFSYLLFFNRWLLKYKPYSHESSSSKGS
jgi:hypothetical protein